MKILITNDDGVHHRGLHTIADRLRGEHDVWIVAPDRNRSAVSHGFTLSKALRIRRLNNKTFSCSGYPADCVTHALLSILNGPPDIVLSGINEGGNIGTDVLYSGTAAGARQASMYGIPGIAVSLVPKNGEYSFDALADFVSVNLTVLSEMCERDVFININAESAESYAGCRLTQLSRRNYKERLEQYTAPDGWTYSYVAGSGIKTDGGDCSDYSAVAAGFISVSRVLAQPVSAGVELFSGSVFTVR